MLSTRENIRSSKPKLIHEMKLNPRVTTEMVMENLLTLSKKVLGHIVKINNAHSNHYLKIRYCIP